MEAVKLALVALSVQEIELLAKELVDLMESDTPPENDSLQERLSEALCNYRK